MHITVNGKTKSFDQKLTLEALLQKLNLEGKVMAAAVNMNIVKQNEWSKYILEDGDKLELLDFVGGG